MSWLRGPVRSSCGSRATGIRRDITIAGTTGTGAVHPTRARTGSRPITRAERMSPGIGAAHAAGSITITAGTTTAIGAISRGNIVRNATNALNIESTGTTGARYIRWISRDTHL